MPKLIKKIEGSFYEYNTSDVLYTKSIVSQIQQEDYINLNGYVSFLQNLFRVNDTFLLTKQANFGLKNKLNIKTKIIDISY